VLPLEQKTLADLALSPDSRTMTGASWEPRVTPHVPQGIPLRNDKTMFVRFGKASARARWRFP